MATGSFGSPYWGSFHQGRGAAPRITYAHSDLRICFYEFAGRRAMSEPISTVNITFQPPTRTNLSRCSSPHRRNLKGVPQSTAQQMAQDFTAYQHEPSAIEEKKLYTYQPSGQNGPPGDEVSVALDFGEIVTLEVARSRTVPARGKKPA